MPASIAATIAEEAREWDLLTDPSACPWWCELPADHDVGSLSGRRHRAEVFSLDHRFEVSVDLVLGAAGGTGSPRAWMYCRPGAVLTDGENRQVADACRAVLGKLREIAESA